MLMESKTGDNPVQHTCKYSVITSVNELTIFSCEKRRKYADITQKQIILLFGDPRHALGYACEIFDNGGTLPYILCELAEELSSIGYPIHKHLIMRSLKISTHDANRTGYKRMHWHRLIHGRRSKPFYVTDDGVAVTIRRPVAHTRKEFRTIMAGIY